MLQVVDSYIRDQTMITTLQAFVEANFLNDMMNASHEIMDKVIH